MLSMMRPLALVLLLACDPSPVGWRIDDGTLHVTVEGYTQVCDVPTVSTEQPDGKWEAVNPSDPECTYDGCTGPITRYQIDLPQTDARRKLDVVYYADPACTTRKEKTVQLE
jgi:hypothetical protein